MREQHLDAFALTARSLEGLGLSERTRDIAASSCMSRVIFRDGVLRTASRFKEQAAQSRLMAR